MKNRRQRRGRGIAGASCLIATLIWVGCSGIICAQEQRTHDEYAALQPIQTSPAPDSNEGNATQTVDRWGQLLNINDACVGWLTVEGTPISYPLVQGDLRCPDYYLYRNVSKERDGSGCPYIDARTSLDGRHVMVFGHHIAGSDTMFGPLASAWKQQTFSRIKTATIARPDRSILTYDVLCSFKTSASDSEIQLFAWADDQTFSAWLQKQVTRSTAKSGRGEIKNPEQVLTLITCSGDVPGKSERTVMMFTRRR